MSNFNTSGLLQALDRIKPELKPLPQHFITSQDQHTRELYATLLAAVLLSDGQVSEPQSRLFGMLLQSMQLEPVPARFFELAQQLDAGKLKQLIQALNHQDQQCALMIDALILARLDSVLSQTQTELLAELLDCFGLSTDLAEHMIALAGMGLGLSNWDEKLIKATTLGHRMSQLSPITAPVWLDKITRTLAENGLYFDPATGLMWSRISIGQQWLNGTAQGQAKGLEWDAAHTACQDFRLAGFSDWQLPSYQQLASLMIGGKPGYSSPDGILYPPSLIGSFGSYWTADSQINYARGISFGGGYASSNIKDSKLYVRAVRTS